MNNTYPVRTNKSIPWAIGVILLYSVINIILLLHHEPWGDEAQAWLLARDLDVTSLFKQVAYEGTPALWHMLLVPFAKTGMPYISEFILNLAIAIAAVSIFIWYAPFSKVTKTLFVFSYYMVYEYAIIARSYSLSVLLLFSIAAFYHNRFKRPLLYSLMVFLLFNTNVHSFFIASSLTLLFTWELYRESVQGNMAKTAVLVMFTGGLVSFLQLLTPPDCNICGIFSTKVYFAPFVAIANTFFPWLTAFIKNRELQLFLIAASFLIFFLTIIAVIRKPAVLFIFLVSLGGLFYIFVFKKPGSINHHGLILIILLFGLWIGNNYSESHKIYLKIISQYNIDLRKISMVLINISLALSLLYAVKVQYLEYRYAFSGAKEMADIIKRNNLTHYTIVAHKSTHTPALLPYLPGEKFWYATFKDYGTFIKYNRKYGEGEKISNVQVISMLGKKFPDKSKILLLLTKPIISPQSYGYTLLFKVDGVFGYRHENFYLYKSIS